MRPRIALPVAAALALVLAAVLSPAAAQVPRVEVQDARDARWPLDLREVDASFERNSLRFTLVTWGRWRARAIHDRSFLVVDLDPRSTARYRVVLRSNGRRIIGALYRKRGGRDRPVRRLRVWRRDRSSVSVRVPAAAIRLPSPGTYAWRAQSLVSGRRCPRVCFDLAPDTGDAIGQIPPPTPAPNPPTPSP
jgi:hypothetical protein